MNKFLAVSLSGVVLITGLTSQQSRSENRDGLVEGIAVNKSEGNPLNNQKKELAWECEPSLLYAAKYNLPQKDIDYVVDFCSAMALVKRDRISQNVIAAADDIEKENSKTKEKFQRYQNTSHFFIAAENIKMTYTGQKGRYRLNWELPALNIALLKNAKQVFANGFIGETLNSNSQVDQAYRSKSASEFFDRKYGNYTVGLKKAELFPSDVGAELIAADELTEYAFEELRNNVGLPEMNHQLSYVLSKSGELQFDIQVNGAEIKIEPQVLKLMFFRRPFKLILGQSNVTVACKKAGLFNVAYKCE